VLRSSKLIDRSLKKVQTYPQKVPQGRVNRHTLQPRGTNAVSHEDIRPVEPVPQRAATTLRRTLTRKNTIKAGATLNIADLARLKIDVKGLQIGPL
jgi:hypothetical protein